MCDDKLARSVGREPYPAGTEEACALRLEFFLELFEGAEIASDGVGNFTRRNVACRRSLELHEIHVVVQELTCVIEHAAFGRLDDFFDSLAFESATRKGCVQIIEVSLQMLTVVEFDGFLAENRSQVACGIRECRHFKFSV